MLSRTTVLTAVALQISMLGNSFAQETQAVPGAQPAAAPQDAISYFIGYTVGQQMLRSEFHVSDFSFERLIAGFRDGLDGKDAAMTDAQRQETQMKIQSLLGARQEERVRLNKQRGITFLAENAKKEGVRQLPGGVQYKELTAGTGPSPKLTDTVRVHYTGKLIDGTKFDSSVGGDPAEFPVNGVIQGWQIAIPQMKVGGKWMVYIPSDLAYGEQGSPGGIGPNEALVFEVELLGIQ